MSHKKTLSDHALTGSNIRRTVEREIARSKVNRTKYGVPKTPRGLNRQELSAWNALVDEYREKLFQTDGQRLAEVARVQVLLAKAFRDAKKGSMVAGRRNPAHSHIAQLTKVRSQLLQPIVSREPAPAQPVSTPIERLNSLIFKNEEVN